MRTLLFVVVVFVSLMIVAGSVSAQTDVTVTNPKSNPVLIRDVDNDARRPYQVSFSIGQPTLPTVPVGKVFVIEYVSGQIRLNSTTGSPTPCRFMQLSFGLGNGADTDVLPVYMGTAQSINNTDVNFFTISQRVQIYGLSNSDLGGTSYSLASSCSPPSYSHIVLSGHLEKAN